MHVRLPKPLHGWRAFAGEVGIIVLGVIIALAFGQVAEAWQWHQEVGTTRKSIHREMAFDLAFLPIGCASRLALTVISWTQSTGSRLWPRPAERPRAMQT
jgi:hypothetical protein